MTRKGDGYSHLITDGTIRLSQDCQVMDACRINLLKDQVAEHRLLQECRRNVLAEVLLLEIPGEEFLCAMEHIQVDDIVIIDLIHLNPIIVHRTQIHLIGSRIHLNIQMVLVIAMADDRITLDESLLVQFHILLVHKRAQVRLIRSLDQLDEIPTLVLELEEMGSQLDDGIPHIACAPHHQGIGIDGKSDRLARRIRIINGITQDSESDILVIFVQPDALQQLLSMLVFLRSIGGLCLLATGEA